MIFFIFRVKVVIRAQDELGSTSFMLFDCHVKDIIHHGKQWLMEKYQKFDNLFQKFKYSKKSIFLLYLLF